LQGSHNASIVLGSARGYKDTDQIDITKSNAHLESALTSGRGAIDLVVGRGRINVDLAGLAGEGDVDSAWPLSPEGDKLTKPPGVTPMRTEPQVIMNARKSFETDKNPNVLNDEISNVQSNVSEGDPDFVNDAARLYLTMKSNPDEDFSLVAGKVPALFKGDLPPAADRACSVLKADEIRIIARKIGPESPTEPAQPADDGKNKAQPYVGSIRLIKEGTRETDASSIYMLPDGTVQISGNSIYIGRTSDDGGKDAGSGEKGSEPYLRMSDFELWADALIDAVNTAFTNAEAAINGNGDKINAGGNAGASGGITPGYGGPNGLLGAAFSQMVAPAGMSGVYVFAGDKSAIEEFKSGKDAMNKIKSERIFGE